MRLQARKPSRQAIEIAVVNDGADSDVVGPAICVPQDDASRRSLTVRIVVGMLAGFVTGAVLNMAGPPELLREYLVDGAFHIVGQVFPDGLPGPFWVKVIAALAGIAVLCSILLGGQLRQKVQSALAEK